MESSSPHWGSQHRPRFMFLASRGRSSFDCGFNDSNLRFLKKNVDKEMTVGLAHCRCKSWREMRINATKGEEGVDDTEDPLEATIEKSKKVLAMQKKLLHQIAERRKLVSSINSSGIEAGEDVVPFGETDDTFHNLGFASDGEGDTEGQFASSTVVNAPENVSNGELGTDSGGSLPLEIFSLDDGFSVTEKKNSDANHTGVSLSFLSKTSKTDGQKDNEEKKLKETVLEGATVEADGAPGKEKPPPLAGINVMNIILVAAECAPWSKTGGLGDVAGALPKALARRGHRVMVLAPLYGNYAELHDTGVRKRYNVTGQDVEVTYHQTYIDGVDFVFINNHMFHHIEQNIYGGERVEILRRMVLFCKAAVEVPWYVPCGGVCYGDGNLVFIANDWHTALLPVYLKAYYRDNGLMSYARSVLVIHNIAHQGRGPLDDFSHMGLPGHYIDLFKLYDPVGGEHCNIFAAGLKAADRIVTVSHGYAWELKTLEGGWGLHGIINDNGWKLSGIVNGIDTKDWNPLLDVHLKSDGYTNYSLETLHTGKPMCKKALQKELGLPIRENVPMVGFIGRLDNQKGVDLIAEAIPWMVEQGVQLVMLGTGRADLENMLRHYENQYHDRVRGWVGFSVQMAHRITAGVDILLMPSRFEPCGLNQLYAMNYGTIPVVHAVGGLRDTVQPFDPYNDSGVGWTFDRAEVHKLIHALGNSLLTYREYKTSWEGIQRRGMMQDLSWDNAAQNYEEVLVTAKYQW